MLLDDLTTLTQDSARELARHEGWLSLNGLRTISLEAATALAQFKTELVWHGKYDEYGRRREVDIAGCGRSGARKDSGS